jgi:hypothetical protein
MLPILSVLYQYYRKRNSESSACEKARLAFVFFCFLYLLPGIQFFYNFLENIFEIYLEDKPIRFFGTLVIIVIFVYLTKRIYSQEKIVSFNEKLIPLQIKRHKLMTILFIAFSFIFVIFLY